MQEDNITSLAKQIALLQAKLDAMSKQMDDTQHEGHDRGEQAISVRERVVKVEVRLDHVERTLLQLVNRTNIAAGGALGAVGGIIWIIRELGGLA